MLPPHTNWSLATSHLLSSWCLTVDSMKSSLKNKTVLRTAETFNVMVGAVNNC